jgi:hypothetical protein
MYIYGGGIDVTGQEWWARSCKRKKTQSQVRMQQPVNNTICLSSHVFRIPTALQLAVSSQGESNRSSYSLLLTAARRSSFCVTYHIISIIPNYPN